MNLSKLPFFNIKWKQRWFQKDYEDCVCLDIGARGSKFKHCFHDYTGIDIVPKDDDIIKCDIHDFVSHRKYDFIIMHHVLEHLEDIDKFKTKLSELRCKGSYLFISVPNPLSLWYYRDITHVRGMNIECIEDNFPEYRTVRKGTPMLRWLPYSIQYWIIHLFPSWFSEFYILLRLK